MTTLLEVRGLEAGYGGIPVLFGVDLDVGEGEIVAVLGANGAGKTTLLRAISGAIAPIAGTVRFLGRDVTGRPADAIARSGLLHVPEGRGLFPSLRVDETLRLAGAMARLGGEEISARIEEAYALFPRLAERRRQPAGTLSGGEQQMLALARGIVVRPRLLLIDEMSQGLAPTVVAGLFDLVRRLPERGTAVLLVEQFVAQALGTASRALVLEKGRVRFSGPATALATDETFVRQSYLGHAVEEAAGEGWRAVGRDGIRVGEEVAVTLPPVLLRGLEERARREGVPLAELVRQALLAGVGGVATAARQDDPGAFRARSAVPGVGDG